MDRNEFENLPIGAQMTVSYIKGVVYQKTGEKSWIIAKSENFPCLIGASANLDHPNEYLVSQCERVDVQLAQEHVNSRGSFVQDLKSMI